MAEDSPSEPIELRRAAIDQYDVRDVHPSVRLGTASDRYAGWLDQIYSRPEYGDRISSRKRSLGGQTFDERRVPIESVESYFKHFDVLELDFPFYRPLLENGERSSTYFVLSKYLAHAPDNASFLLKAPQKFFARTIRRQNSFVDNPTFLDAEGYMKTFHEPVVDLLGDHLDGIIFQQEYQRVAESPTPEENVDQLDAFFSSIPDDVQLHIELRSEHLLSSVYFDWLDANGLGHIFSHWTWLPPIREQWSQCGERFTAQNNQVVSRLLTPQNVKYVDAYAKAYPFDAPAPELCETKEAHNMILDVTALVYRAEEQNALVNVLANNRAWGNAPDLARRVAHRIVDETERRQ